MRLEKVITVEQDVTLLNNFNLHIFKGEIMGLIAINDNGLDSLVELICKIDPCITAMCFLRKSL